MRETRHLSNFATVYIGVSQNGGYPFGVSIIRVLLYWDLLGMPLFGETTTSEKGLKML